MNETRLALLPKWAQQYIQKLQKDVEWYKKQLRQTSSGDSPITWEVVTGNSEAKGIPERAYVSFKTPRGTIDFVLRDGRIIAQLHDVGSICVVGCAANQFYILPFVEHD